MLISQNWWYFTGKATQRQKIVGYPAETLAHQCHAYHASHPCPLDHKKIYPKRSKTGQIPDTQAFWEFFCVLKANSCHQKKKVSVAVADPKATFSESAVTQVEWHSYWLTSRCIHAVALFSEFPARIVHSLHSQKISFLAKWFLKTMQSYFIVYKVLSYADLDICSNSYQTSHF